MRAFRGSLLILLALAALAALAAGAANPAAAAVAAQAAQGPDAAAVADGDDVRIDASTQRVESVVWANGSGSDATGVRIRADSRHFLSSDQFASGVVSARSGAESDGARDCEASLRLPWGPITDCRQAVIAAAVGATAAVSVLAWWGQGFSSDFNVANEGWFGHDTYAGGIDKLGHAYSFYLGTRLGTRALGWAQVPHADALHLAAGVGLGVGLGIEVLDGLSRSGQYGFSWQDMAMNVVGIGAGVLMESNPALDERLAFRWMYRSGGEEWYDSHIYLLAYRPAGVSRLGRNNPLRYVELLAGYGAKGFRSDFDFSAGDHRQRSVYLGIGLNLSELLNRSRRTARDAGAAPTWTEETLRYVQVPGTVVAKAWHRRP